MAPSAMPPTPPMEEATMFTTASIKHLNSKLMKLDVSGNGTKPAPLDASKLNITLTTNPRVIPAPDDPLRKVTGYATDHMIVCNWNSTTGWGAPELKPYGPLSLMPTASVLHYATECFEGQKAYRGYDGAIRLFRPDCNASRLLMSATRIALPAFEPAEVEKLVKALIAVDGSRWLPKDEPGKMLYIRPAMIGTTAELGVQAPKEAMLFIVVTFMPEHAETPGGFKLLASEDDTVRAWPGGFGYAKLGANYGPSLHAQADARRRGYDQMLWLIGEDAKVTEAGASNFMAVIRSKEGTVQLITAPLDDMIILDGVTRRSVLQLARERLSIGGALEPVEVVVRHYTMWELVEAGKEGRLLECFACGTAFFVVPVSKIHFRGQDLHIPMSRGASGDYTFALKTWLKNIMYGAEAHPWGVVIDEVSA